MNESVDEARLFINIHDSVTPIAGEAVNLDIDLYNLLLKWNLTVLYGTLQENDINFESLRYLSVEDIKDTIQSVGLRAKFREKLFVWREEKFGILDNTLTASSKVLTWLQSSLTPTQEDSPVPNTDLTDVLKISNKGQAIVAFYKKNNFLTNCHRDDLISLVLEHLLFDAKNLIQINKFSEITESIVKVFPTECKEYYFVPRQGKRNPAGKLYDKYIYARRKRKFCEYSSTKESKKISLVGRALAADEDILEQYKETISKDISDWTNVLDKWEKTFSLRQKEVKTHKSNSDFLKSWPAFADARAPELINIDFNLLNPGKNIFNEKWDLFKTKIVDFYAENIHDKQSKKLLQSIQNLKNINSIDYIIAVLINSVIHPSARFKDESKTSGKRKATIADAQEAFVLHLNTLNKYEEEVSKLTNKYYSAGLTIQPLIIVVGSDIFELEHFYVYFDKILYKCDRFLDCVDICFKLFHILSLEYPKACQGCWMFIQKHLYEISTEFDFNISSVSTLINFLNSNN